VVEFFWYSCPHCNAFEPTLEAWVKKLPADVAFRRVHVGFRPNFEPQQRLFATLEALGQLEAMHRKVFHAIHQQRQKLDRAEDIFDFIEKSGGDRVKFTEMYNSFGVQTKVRQGKQLAEAYKIDGVPALGIHGRFYTSPSLAGGDNIPELEGGQRALALTEQLVARVRKGG
jgi:protein dithiol oxidoreductase (disulfide-forming)